MKELKMDFVFIEVDKGIYTEVLVVILPLKIKSEYIFPTIISLMSGFHIDMCLLHTIYSLFRRCGIVQLLSSKVLGGVRR